MIKTQLSVNVNKVACLRNARGGDVPNVERMTQLIIDAGAHGITVHPRPDLRHITPHDVMVLRDLCRDQCEFNIEGNPFHPATDTFPGLISLALTTLPEQVTLVPDTATQVTSDHGWDFDTHTDSLIPIIEQLQAKGIRVSLFVNPNKKSIEQAAKTGCDRIELYTEEYAVAYKSGEGKQSAAHYQAMAEYAKRLHLGCNAGHDLNEKNLKDLIKLNHFDEVSIGQALIADALIDGIQATVTVYLNQLKADIIA